MSNKRRSVRAYGKELDAELAARVANREAHPIAYALTELMYAAAASAHAEGDAGRRDSLRSRASYIERFVADIHGHPKAADLTEEQAMAEIHAAGLLSPEIVSPSAADDIFARIAAMDNPVVPVAPPAPKVEHVMSVERRDHIWPARATCSCGWLGIWHATELRTRQSARNHMEAYGLTLEGK